MARLSNISVVVPLPSFDIDPLKTFDEDFFDRAVDNILSEEASIEESRDEMMDSNIGISSPFGYDGASDSSKSKLRRSQRTEAKSPHFSTPASNSSPTTTTAKKPKLRTSSRIRKSATMEDVNGNNEAPVSPENITPPQNEELIEAESYPIHEAGDHPSTLPEINESAAMPTGDDEMTAEDKIFVSLDLEKQIEVLKYVASHSFMMEQARPVQRSARREFTGQVRGFAAKAGMNDTAIDALIDHIRKTYLEDRGIAAAADAGSAFGDEVDNEEERQTRSSHRKRRKSSSDHPEDKDHKKSKRRHSDKARGHSHDTMYDEPTKVVEAHVPAGVSTEAQDNGYVKPDGPEDEDNTPDLPQMPTSVVRSSPYTHIDLTTDSPPYDEVDAVPDQFERVNAVAGPKELEASNREVLARQLSSDVPGDIIPESPSPEKVVEEKPLKRREPLKSSKEKNKRKRERKRERNKHRINLSGQKQPQGDSIDGAEKQTQGDSVDGANQDRIPPSIPKQTSFESTSGNRRRSSQFPLPTDPSLWNIEDF
ncbi:hypothetical protein N7471_006360 [Penicillium samsonianum]|uniref:uncharacterized protein n=1 Tax=Penicillium samsonianum TaxID=1882272 RepID=UPI002548A05F|nr:uncharacterized protein N7471_006360 [Penicillium samsonianum]KAJ6139874.1 hypothetical protein N7471_006360 [Penicillium samsonianum]